MTPIPPMADPAAIAAGLTKAQRNWLPSFSEQPKPYLPIGMSRRTRESLVDLSLVEKISPRTGFGLVLFGLTPLGLRVRQILEETKL